MKFCNKCAYPSNAKPTITFDDFGICSGCRYNDYRSNSEINWVERFEELRNLLQEYSTLARKNGAEYDCIIPVSGGKDSSFQVWLVKEKLGLKPLLVHFNHQFNSTAGLRNLDNLIQVSNCDLITVSLEPDVIKKVARKMTLEIGDITWHYHAGIMTAPFRVAVKFGIPLILWGEHGFGELTGVVSLKDKPEFTNWKRKQYDMRGIDPLKLSQELDLPNGALDELIFPSREEIEKIGIRGIYLSNYLNWNALGHAQEMHEKYGFSPITYRRDRTFNLYSKIEDHANDVHDYLKFLKFGYGRATDDASMELRHERLSRTTAFVLINEYDSNEPQSLGYYLDYLELSRKDFFSAVENSRDLDVWEFANSTWKIKDDIQRYRLEQINKPPIRQDLIFTKNFQPYYYNPANPPKSSGDEKLDKNSLRPEIGKL